MSTNRSPRRENRNEEGTTKKEKKFVERAVDRKEKQLGKEHSSDLYDMSQFEKITGETIRELISHEHECSISLYMPAHRGGRDVREDPIAFKDLIEQVEKKLTNHMKTSEIEELTAPLREMLNDFTFWEYQLDGLAVFRSKNYLKCLRVAIPFEETCIIAPEFYVKPLMPVVSEETSFYILSISRNFARLYFADRDMIQELNIPSMPDSMGDALWYKKIQNEGGFHNKYRAGQGNPSLYYRNSEWKDKDKIYLSEYLRKVDDSIKPVLAGKTTPLILTTVEPLVYLYKEATTYTHLLPEFIHGNPEEFELHELHQKAWEIIEKHLEEKKKERIEGYKNLMGSDRFISQIDKILPAASDGLIETLFVNKNDKSWGWYDDKKRAITSKQGDPLHSDDLLNIATINTIKNHGTVMVLAAEEMPVDTSPAVAVLRYSPHL